ncbi:hypothetical protein MMC13_003148 [Lambiella insularis]|nr:hypothetical protein [Lambiella insularis]
MTTPTHLPFLPPEMITDILEMLTGDEGILMLWNSCRRVSRAWKIIVEKLFVEKHLPDTTILFHLPHHVCNVGRFFEEIKLIDHPLRPTCLATSSGPVKDIEIKFAFHGLSEGDHNIALFGYNGPLATTPHIVMRQFFEKQVPRFMETVGTPECCRMVTLKRFANDTQIPEYNATWAEIPQIPQIRCDWKKTLTQLLTEEQHVSRSRQLWLDGLEARKTPLSRTHEVNEDEMNFLCGYDRRAEYNEYDDSDNPEFEDYNLLNKLIAVEKYGRERVYITERSRRRSRLKIGVLPEQSWQWIWVQRRLRCVRAELLHQQFSDDEEGIKELREIVWDQYECRDNWIDFQLARLDVDWLNDILLSAKIRGLKRRQARMHSKVVSLNVKSQSISARLRDLECDVTSDEVGVSVGDEHPDTNTSGSDEDSDTNSSESDEDSVTRSPDAE